MREATEGEPVLEVWYKVDLGRQLEAAMRPDQATALKILAKIRLVLEDPSTAKPIKRAIDAWDKNTFVAGNPHAGRTREARKR